MTQLADQLREVRLKRGLSRTFVVASAKRLEPEVRGLHCTNLREWERGLDGERSPNPQQLQAWAAALGFEVTLQPRAA